MRIDLGITVSVRKIVSFPIGLRLGQKVLGNRGRSRLGSIGASIDDARGSSAGPNGRTVPSKAASAWLIRRTICSDRYATSVGAIRSVSCLKPLRRIFCSMTEQLNSLAALSTHTGARPENVAGGKVGKSGQTPTTMNVLKLLPPAAGVAPLLDGAEAQ